MTQQQLADATGMHRVSINKMEHGLLDVGVSNVTALASALGVDANELFSKGRPWLPYRGVREGQRRRCAWREPRSSDRTQ
ncbi:helix-turn-helix domain-containing protein [Knoellia subterranea]